MTRWFGVWTFVCVLVLACSGSPPLDPVRDEGFPADIADPDAGPGDPGQDPGQDPGNPDTPDTPDPGKVDADEGLDAFARADAPEGVDPAADTGLEDPGQDDLGDLCGPGCPSTPCRTGTCVSGVGCVFRDVEGSCDDGDPCTGPDICQSGTCLASPVVCDSPPPDTCIDGMTLGRAEQVGICVPAEGCRYERELQPCSAGCRNGRCGELVGLWQAEFTAGGQAAWAMNATRAACVLPGWYEGATLATTDGLWVIDAGFEP